MFALKNLVFELRPISTVFAFLDNYHAVFTSRTGPVLGKS